MVLVAIIHDIINVLLNLMSARINRILNYFVKGVYTYFTHVFTKINTFIKVDFGALRYVEYTVQMNCRVRDVGIDQSAHRDSSSARF